MTEYQREQFQALKIVRNHLNALSASERNRLDRMIGAYLDFRKETEAFLSSRFSRICTRNCYESRLSACCSKDGIITFFADAVINALRSSEAELDALGAVLVKPHTGFKCVYLGENGCLWKIKPVVCEMFLCDPARREVLEKSPEDQAAWNRLEARRKRFTWPDRPVLFDDLETVFIKAGHSSSLMYLHRSPGLLRIKRLGKKKEES